MQIDVHDVEAHIAGTNLAQQRVEVSSVVIEQTACLVYEVGNLKNLYLEKAKSVGVGHHDAGD